MTTFEQHVRASSTPTREEIDHFLDPEKLSWGQFDPEVGYILGNYSAPRRHRQQCYHQHRAKKWNPQRSPVRGSTPVASIPMATASLKVPK